MHEMHAFVAHIHVSKEFTAEFTDANVIISLVTFEQTRCAALFALSDARNNAINRFSFVSNIKAIIYRYYLPFYLIDTYDDWSTKLYEVKRSPEFHNKNSGFHVISNCCNT